MREYGSPAPSTNSLRGWLRVFQERGTVVHKSRFGHPPMRYNDVSRIENPVQENRRNSARVAIAEQRTSFSTIGDVLGEDLKMFPYKMLFLQPLLQEDYPLRLDYSPIILHELNNESGYLGRIVFSGKCIFRTNEVINKHNVRVWGLERPGLSKRY